MEGRAVYAQAADISSEADAEALVGKCRQAGLGVIILGVKEAGGAIYFDSTRFLAARVSGVATFDPLKTLLKAAKKERIAVHAALCAFVEGPGSPAANDHPEWAALTRLGRTTVDSEGSEVLWMCPARRPGYADGYLIPMIEELLKNYDVDGIHLRNLSFPGEVEPDSFCFCDYCIQEFQRHSRLFYPVLPDTRFEAKRQLADGQPDWSEGPTALPADYDAFSRKIRGEYMLKGSYAKRGPSDMDYFLYTYRTDAVRLFCAELYEKARAIRPKLEFSATVYWNAPAAGRFAGQRWTDFGQWFDFLVPDMSRSSLPGDFETYGKLLADVGFYVTRSSRNLVYTYAGLNLEDVYREERASLEEMLDVLGELARNPGKDPRLPATKLTAAFEKIEAGLRAADETLAADLKESIESLVARVAESPSPGEVYTTLGVKVQKLKDHAPEGFYRPQKLRSALKSLQGAGLASVALTDAGALDRLKLWGSLPSVLGPQGREPYRVRPLRAPSAQTVRLFVQKQEQLASASAEIELLNRRLNQVRHQLEPLRSRLEEYELTEKSKLEKLDGLILELDGLREEYSGKLAELERLRAGLGEIPEGPVPKPFEMPPDMELPSEDADYATLRLRLEEKVEELKIAIGQRHRAEELAVRLSVEMEKAHESLAQQEQEYLYYVSIIIALACIGLAVVLVVSMIRHRR